MLKKKRREKHLTQSELARKIGITESYVNKLEKHPQVCNPSVNLILKLSKELGVNPIEIFLFFIKNREDQDI